MNIGQRVMVSIPDFSEYAMGCANSLHGKTGTVVEYKTPYPGDGKKALVQFDHPPEAWYTHQRPSDNFWFTPDHLRSIR